MSKHKTIYIVSAVVNDPRVGHIHHLVAAYYTSQSALEEQRRLKDENRGTDFIVEPWPLEP